jgi:hypothetical protein
LHGKGIFGANIIPITKQYSPNFKNFLASFFVEFGIFSRKKSIGTCEPKYNLLLVEILFGFGRTRIVNVG